MKLGKNTKSFYFYTHRYLKKNYFDKRVNFFYDIKQIYTNNQLTTRSITSHKQVEKQITKMFYATTAQLTPITSTSKYLGHCDLARGLSSMRFRLRNL